MNPRTAQVEVSKRPRVGIPWRTSEEEAANNLPKIKNYDDAVIKAGGEAVRLPLRDAAELQRLLPSLDAFVLPGSPSDVEPAEYGAANRGLSEPPDLPREETDRAILKHAFSEKKPVLAICYGCQTLNVYQGGSLIQDIHTELKNSDKKLERHRKKDEPPSSNDPIHGAAFEPDSRLADIAGSTQARINSSHHQAIEKPGKNLRITAHATDGIIEGLEWTGDSNWVVGVQWHPERMTGDAFAERLFNDFVAAARGAVKQEA
ncbi:MAG TPA: gamma-glutamyl-gamma-aminobutyrate hydrolase family protein [Candidatus Acidoferrum sp.]|jgi:putative glutamine amidotransferase|nr:gamma-glutamyl-gamma-aminobutyrate hydrolase family protein [Candidatus Acidoferrum sp.]